MPFFFISRSSPCAISSSSAGTRRGSISISVTCVPIAAKKHANSQPTTPPPSTASRLGWRESSSASCEVITRSPSSEKPGGMPATAPVARMMCSAVISRPAPPGSLIRSRFTAVSLAAPFKISTWRPWSSVFTPLVSWDTTFFLRSSSQPQLTLGAPTSMPNSLARWICS